MTEVIRISVIIFILAFKVRSVVFDIVLDIFWEKNILKS